MIQNQKRIFLYALILTFVVFNVGIFMGYMMESSRISQINSMYTTAEIELLDQMAQKNSLSILDLDCDLLVQENIKFGDKVYQEALTIQRYEDANIMGTEIATQHKRFDLLRALFWINSIEIKQKCNPDYHDIVYFYKYNDPSIEQESKQDLFSNLLGELKENKGDGLMLIPIAGDNDIPSINLLIKKYNVTEFPTILIDEKIKVINVEEIEDIEKYLQ